MATPTRDDLRRKLLPGLLLVFAMSASGFLLGGLAARLTIPPGGGLAAAGTAAFYALGGAVVSFLGSALLILRLKPRTLWMATAGALAVAVGLAMTLRALGPNHPPRPSDADQNNSHVQPKTTTVPGEQPPGLDPLGDPR
jgi:hypothetical protein